MTRYLPTAKGTPIAATQIDVQTLLKQLSEKATIYVQNKNELEAVGATNNLRGLAANIKFTDQILPQAETTVKRKLSDRDSSGTQLSKEQADYFRNSKVRDEQGNLLVMYHGTPNGGFTKFRSGSYFTQNPEYAALYQNAGASMLSQKKNADNPQNYQVYLNIEKPFDTRNPKERRIFMQEYYRQYGTGAPLSDSGLPDWTDGMDLQEFIEDMGYDYDGLILDEGATGGYGEEVKSRGLSYVTFNPEQVKNVDNTTPTADPDIRYSDRDPEMAKLKQQDRSLWQKMKDFITDLAQKIRMAYAKLKPDSAEGRIVAEMKDSIEKLQELFAEALVDASENYRAAEVKENTDREGGERYQTRPSERDTSPYSYENLTAKPDMVVTAVGGNVPNNRADVVHQAKRNAAKVGKFNTKDGSVSVHVKDIGKDVVLGTAGLKHSLDRRFDVNAPVTLKAGEILSNSIQINELTPQKTDADESYVLIGAAKGENGELYVVRSVVNKFSSELSSMDVLYAINAKKGNRLRSMRPGFQGPVTDSTISISELLDYVNDYFPDILPEGVLKHYGYDARPEGKLGESALYSDRDPEMAKVNRVLEQENAKLKEDVSYLLELLKLQRQVAGGTKFTKSSVEAAAGVMMKAESAKGGDYKILPCCAILTANKWGRNQYDAGRFLQSWNPYSEQCRKSGYPR